MIGKGEKNKRRINTEEKAKVINAVCRTYLNAAPNI